MSEIQAKRHKTLYSCGYDGCTYFTFRKDDMTRHKRIHTGERPYKCDFLNCNAAFAKSCDLKRHTMIHTGEKPYKCDFVGCNVAFSQRVNLDSHKRIHMGEKPYKCDFLNCNAAFTKSCGLKRHARIHTGEKPYVCDVLDCNAAFSDPSGFTKHKRIHTGEKPYKCDVLNCNAAFSDPSAFTKHKRIHTGERPYKCDFLNCNAAFAKSGDLTTHKRTHTGEKPYKCDFLNCNAAFAKSGDLTTHKRTHTGEKPYKCDVLNCNAAFSDKAGYTRHKRIHTGEKPYKCKICEYAFTQSGNLHNHMRIHHTIEYNASKKIQEEKVSQLLTESGYIQLYNLGDALPPPGHYKREHHINFNCGSENSEQKWCRIDFIINSNGTYIFLEVDEDQHRFGYNAKLSCDCKRMTDVQATVIQSDDRISPIYWLRYNPQAWHCNEETIRVPTEVRHRFLMERINEVQPSESIRIEYMFYDIVDDELEVITNEEYADCFRPLAFQLTSPEKFGVVFCQECN